MRESIMFPIFIGVIIAVIVPLTYFIDVVPTDNSAKENLALIPISDCKTIIVMIAKHPYYADGKDWSLDNKLMQDMKKAWSDRFDEVCKK